MKRILFIVAFCLLASSASAQVYTRSTIRQRLIGLRMGQGQAKEIADLTTGKAPLPNGTPLASLNAAGTANLTLLYADASDNTVLNAASGKVGHVAIAKTPYVVFSTSSLYPATNNSLALGYSGSRFGSLYLGPGASVQSAGYVPTMAATPVAGTNIFKDGLNIIPTAAAGTAALLPTPSAIGGIIEYDIINNSGASVRIKPGGTNTLNGGAAGAFYTSATGERVKCYAFSGGTNNICYVAQNATLPTPSGP